MNVNDKTFGDRLGDRFVGLFTDFVMRADELRKTKMVLFKFQFSQICLPQRHRRWSIIDPKASQ